MNIRLDEKAGLAVFEPDGALSAADFQAAADAIDPFIEAHGRLRGLVIRTRTFPGWDSLAGFVGHLRFVRDHHKRLERVALVTDSPLGDLAEKLGDHFVVAEVKHFPFADFEAATAWAVG